MAEDKMWSMIDDVIVDVRPVFSLMSLGSCSLMFSLLMTSSPFLLWWQSSLSSLVSLLMILLISSQQRLMMMMCRRVVAPSEMLMQGPVGSLFSKMSLEPQWPSQWDVSLMCPERDEEEGRCPIIRWWLSHPSLMGCLPGLYSTQSLSLTLMRLSCKDAIRDGSLMSGQCNQWWQCWCQSWWPKRWWQDDAMSCGP